MKYPVVIMQGPTSFGAMVPDLPGVYAVGETIEETQDLIAGAMVMHIRALVADDEPVPQPSRGMHVVEIAI